MLRFFTLGIIATMVSGCAIGQRSNYVGNLHFEPTEISATAPLVVAIQDQRPSVLDGSDSESRVGTLRSIAGVPWAVKTTSGNPLATDLGTSLVQTLNAKNYNATSLEVRPTDDESTIHSKGQALSPGSRTLLFSMKAWANEIWFGSQLKYCVDLIVREANGFSRRTASACDQKALGPGEPGFTDLREATGTVFGSLINSADTQQALLGATAAQPTQVRMKPDGKATADRLRMLKELNEQGILTQEELDAKRRKILEDV